MRRSGYILIEALVAMGLLSVGMVAISNSLHQAYLTRAIGHDRTDARFLLEQVAGTVSLQTFIEPTKEQGVFPENPRFAYAYTIDFITVDIPTPDPGIRDRQVRQAVPPVPFIPRLRVAVRWQRANARYEEVIETLLPPEKVPQELMQRLVASGELQRNG